MTDPINPIHTYLDVNIFNSAKEAAVEGFDYNKRVKPVTPLRVKNAVVVRQSTQNGNSTVDFLMTDAAGQEYVIMMTGNILSVVAQVACAKVGK